MDNIANTMNFGTPFLQILTCIAGSATRRLHYSGLSQDIYICSALKARVMSKLKNL